MEPHDQRLLSMGVPGLNDVLGGGLEPNRLYLFEGTPGAGKTTIAMQFLLEGVARGESVLYVTLSETEHELRGVAVSHGWDISNVHVREMLLATPAQRGPLLASCPLVDVGNANHHEKKAGELEDDDDDD